MTNFEKWKDEIADICDTGDNVAIVNGIPVGCNTLYDCTECGFDGINECDYRLLEWAASEYEEPAHKLTKKEREFLECFSAKDRKAISRYTGGKLAVINTTYSLCEAEINSEMFPFVGSDKVWMFEDLLKLEVEE